MSLMTVCARFFRNDHRTLMRNSRFIQSKIDNLSRVASTDGVRQAPHYNIGYRIIPEGTREERAAAMRSIAACYFCSIQRLDLVPS